MKKVVLSCALLSTAFAGFSQTTIEPEVGANFSKISYKLGDDDRFSNDALTGLRAGVGIRFGLGENFYLKPGVYFSTQGTQSEVLGVTYTTALNYIQIPVNIGYHFKISDKAGAIFGEVGPYLGYAIGGTNKSDGAIIDYKNDINLGTDNNETNPLDYGVNVGLGYETPWGVYIKGGYGLGLGNQFNVDNANANNRVFNVSLGYKINL